MADYSAITKDESPHDYSYLKRLSYNGHALTVTTKNESPHDYSYLKRLSYKKAIGPEATL